MGDKSRTDGNNSTRAVRGKSKAHQGGHRVVLGTRQELDRWGRSLEDQGTRLRRGGGLSELGSTSKALGTQISQCWDGEITGCVDVFGENSKGIDLCTLGSPCNLNLLFSHSGSYGLTAPTVPFCKTVLSFQEKENLLFCRAEVLIFHPLFRSGRGGWFTVR